MLLIFSFLMPTKRVGWAKTKRNSMFRKIIIELYIQSVHITRKLCIYACIHFVVSFMFTLSSPSIQNFERKKFIVNLWPSVLTLSCKLLFTEICQRINYKLFIQYKISKALKYHINVRIILSLTCWNYYSKFLILAYIWVQKYND